DYADPGLAEKIRSATDGRGVDLILDMSAGAHITQDLVAIAPGGRISFLSAGGGKDLALPLRALMAQRASITGALLRSTSIDIKCRIAQAPRRPVWPLLGTAIKPVIGSVYLLSEAAAAHRHMELNAHIGKLLLAVNPAMAASS